MALMVPLFCLRVILQFKCLKTPPKLALDEFDTREKKTKKRRALNVIKKRINQL